MDTENHYYWNTVKGSIVIIGTLAGERVGEEYLTDLIAVPEPPSGNDWAWDAEASEWKQPAPSGRKKTT